MTGLPPSPRSTARRCCLLRTRSGRNVRVNAEAGASTAEATRESTSYLLTDRTEDTGVSSLRNLLSADRELLSRFRPTEQSRTESCHPEVLPLLRLLSLRIQNRLHHHRLPKVPRAQLEEALSWLAWFELFRTRCWLKHTLDVLITQKDCGAETLHDCLSVCLFIYLAICLHLHPHLCLHL